MRVSIVIPTMNRADRIERCVKRLFEVTPYDDLECVIVIDVDGESLRRVQELGEDRINVIFNAQRRGAIACWNQGLEAATGDILVFANDDCWWMPSWLDAALAAHQEKLNGYGLVGFNDGYQDGNVLAVHYLFDRQFCIDHLGGVMGYPVYEFYYVDTEANARAKLAKRFYWCQEAVVEHQHWSRPGENHFDEIDRENQPKAARDAIIFEARKAHGFPNNFEAVLKG